MSNHMQYELLYIVPSTFTDEDVARIEGNVKTLLEKYGATLTDTKRLGKFRFAYPIKNVRHGHYVLVQFETATDTVAKIEEALRISTEVLRHLIVRADEAGGDKFELIQFTEVNVDMKDDRPRRRREEKAGDEKVGEDKAAVAVLEKDGEEAVVAPAAISDEELDKKLTAALEGDVKEA